MNCEELEILIAEDLDEAKHGAAAVHLESCGPCRGLYRQMSADAAALRALDGVTDADVAVLRSRLLTPRRSRRWPVAVAAAAMLVAVGLWWPTSTSEKRGLPLAQPVAVAVAKQDAPPVKQAGIVRRVKREPPLMVKLETEDPNVVIYWQIAGDENGELE